ncbi:MAG TPA: radical SAM protein, partial [Candidatus Saccharimonadales bacterium]|nr:radical SAM protein [Candidatus Saccharimonadales bacterium]
PTAKVGFIGAKVAVEPNESLAACPGLDFVCRGEYEDTVKELAEGKPYAEILGLTYRDANGEIQSTRERPIREDMDELPSVLPLYKQLKVENYFGGYLLHPYMSWYTGRGCKSRCTFCLWPQTISGHRYRLQSVARVVEDVKYVQREFPQIREIFFDDDTLTDNHDRVEQLAKALGPLGVTWSCNAKANVPRKTLEVMKANGLRLLLVGYESGNQQILHNIKKGLLVDVAKRFSRDCHELGIVVHGTFILGLPGETRETIQELARGDEWSSIKGLTWRNAAGEIVANPEREILMDMDKLPSVLPLYKQLKVEKYFGGYLLHPYMSWYTGRGCKSRCTFCLWPQTIGGHKYRFMSIDRVVRDVKYVKEHFPEVKEIFFDDDTLTDNHDRVEELAKALGPLGVTWSCNAKANVPRKTLEVMKANGLRLLLVGYESGNQQILHNIKKGLLVDVAKRFSKDCRELGIVVHGTFILGLPGETRETIQETLAFAKEVNPHTIQVSLAAPYPGTFLYKQAKENGWFASDVDLLTEDGTQIAPLNYPHLGH